MSRSELVSPQHLQRKALIYIRQSTPHQLLSNQESLRLQYALHQRAVDLGLPRRDRFSDVVCKKPTVAAILQILKNPAYAGAFVYGKTRSIGTDPTSPHTQEVRLPMAEWKIRIDDVYPAYIAWETFEQIQQMLADNYAAYDRNTSRGVPRDGAARLAWDRLLWRVRPQNGHMGHAPTAPICVSNIVSRSAKKFQQTPLICRWWRAFFRRYTKRPCDARSSTRGWCIAWLVIGCKRALSGKEATR